MRCEEFFPNFSKLARKILGHFLCEHFLMKTVLGAISSNQSTLGAILARIFKEFAQIFRDFEKVFTNFAQISPDFVRILTKTFGGTLAPPAPQLPTPLVIAMSLDHIRSCNADVAIPMPKIWLLLYHYK